MALQSSGAISLLNVQTEFGGSNPISISEYYGVDTGVPVSGTISLDDFYGTSAADVTPDALVFPPSMGPGFSSNTDTVTGIDTPINIVLSGTMNTSPGLVVTNTITLRNTTQSTSASSTVSTVDGTFTTSAISFNNNDVMVIEFNETGSGLNSTPNGTINIVNQSDSDAVLDTITVEARQDLGEGL